MKSDPYKMSGQFLKSIEQIMIAVRTNHAKVIGFLSAQTGAGVSLISHEVSKSFTSSGLKTLRIDLSDPILRKDDFKPGQDQAVKFSDHILETDLGVKVIDFSRTGISPFVFYNNEFIRNIFQNDLAEYEKIILELPPVLLKTDDWVAPLSAAAICDCLFLVCPTGQVTRTELKEINKALRSVNLRLSGVILNDFYFQHKLPDFLTSMDFYSHFIQKKFQSAKTFFKRA